MALSGSKRVHFGAYHCALGDGLEIKKDTSNCGLHVSPRNDFRDGLQNDFTKVHLDALFILALCKYRGICPGRAALLH